LTPKAERVYLRKEAEKLSEEDRASGPAAKKPSEADRLAWQADRNRAYLHASRTLGVAAAAFIALLSRRRHGARLSLPLPLPTAGPTPVGWREE